METIMINYTIIRSKRKSIAIYITKEATVEVRAPLKMAKSDIDRFVVSKQNWVCKHLAAREQQIENKAAFALNYGDSVPAQGKAYPITAKDGNKAGFDGKCFFLPPGLPPDEIKHAVIQVYRLLAKRLLSNKIIYYEKISGLVPASVKINGAKTRWGSCSGKNSINFSWRLIMADDDVIDYVVVHELAHIKEHNHSARFWATVSAILPDYKARLAKLKKLQKRLANEDWE